jgi:hypothetical protein
MPGSVESGTLYKFIAYMWNGKEMYKSMFWIKEKWKIKEANIYACDSCSLKKLIAKLISGFHRASLLSVTFINQLMHSIITAVDVKIYVV